MQVFFIENKSKKRIFRKIEVKDDKIILNLNFEKVKLKRKIKIVKDIKNIICKNKVNKIVIDKSLKRDKEFINLLYSNEIDIVDGRILFKQILDKIIDNICNQNNFKSEEKRISIVTNFANRLNSNLIENLSKKFKMLNIVTNNINEFHIIREKMWENEGIVISVTNNKKKALLRSDIIINFDFPEELLNKYTIFDNSIIINLEEDIKIKKKRFNGTIINNYNITLKKGSKIANDLSKFKDYDFKDLAEIYLMNNPEEIINVEYELF